MTKLKLSQEYHCINIWIRRSQRLLQDPKLVEDREHSQAVQMERHVSFSERFGVEAPRFGFWAPESGPPDRTVAQQKLTNAFLCFQIRFRKSRRAGVPRRTGRWAGVGIWARPGDTRPRPRRAYSPDWSPHPTTSGSCSPGGCLPSPHPTHTSPSTRLSTSSNVPSVVSYLHACGFTLHCCSVNDTLKYHLPFRKSNKTLFIIQCALNGRCMQCLFLC